MVEVGKAEAALGELKNLGAKLALDDFGTGYSSLSYLERLSTDLLKLDRAFVENLGSSPKKYAVFRAVVDLAHATGMAVVAEGIETEGQLGALRRAGCDLAQGHLFSKPLEAEEAASLIEGRS